MKYKLPQGCARLSHAGRAVTIAPDMTIDLDPAQVALLEPHDIVPVGDPAPVDPAAIDSMTSDELAAALAERGIVAPAAAGTGALRGLLRQALAKPSR